MTFIPAGVAAIAIIAVWAYPLTTARMKTIDKELRVRRSEQAAVDVADNFNDINN